MAEAIKEGAGVVFLNKGMRHFDLAAGADGKPRRHSPGQTMEYSAAEADSHSGYSDLIDISKMPTSVNTKKLAAEKAALVDENAELKARIAALEGKSAKAKPEAKKEAKEEVKA